MKAHGFLASLRTRETLTMMYAIKMQDRPKSHNIARHTAIVIPICSVSSGSRFEVFRWNIEKPWVGCVTKSNGVRLIPNAATKTIAATPSRIWGSFIAVIAGEL
jgi:hypothetical protein